MRSAVMSSAATTLAKQSRGSRSTNFESDAAGGTHRNERIESWIASSITSPLDSEGQSPTSPLDSKTQASRSDAPLRTKFHYELDSDDDLEIDLARALLNRGQERLEAKNYSKAEKALRNCLSRVVNASEIHSAIRETASSLLVECLIQQQRWQEAKDEVQTRLATIQGSAPADNPRSFKDMSVLIDILIAQRNFSEAQLYGRRLLSKYRKGRDPDVAGIERILRTLIEICRNDNNPGEEEAYSSMLSDLLQIHPTQSEPKAVGPFPGRVERDQIDTNSPSADLSSSYQNSPCSQFGAAVWSEAGNSPSWTPITPQSKAPNGIDLFEKYSNHSQAFQADVNGIMADTHHHRLRCAATTLKSSPDWQSDPPLIRLPTTPAELPSDDRQSNKMECFELPAEPVDRVTKMIDQGTESAQLRCASATPKSLVRHYYLQSRKTYEDVTRVRLPRLTLNTNVEPDNSQPHAPGGWAEPIAVPKLKLDIIKARQASRPPVSQFHQPQSPNHNASTSSQAPLPCISSGPSPTNSSPTQTECRAKILCVGDTSSGKTSLLMRQSEGKFNQWGPTDSFSNFLCNVQLPGKSVELAFYDTNGSDRYDPWRRLSYPGTDIVLLCFSISEPETLMNAEDKWIPEIRANLGDVPIFLVGTMSDTRTDKSSTDRSNIITVATGEAFARRIGALRYNETSAVSGEGVKELFERISIFCFVRKRMQSEHKKSFKQMLKKTIRKLPDK